MAAETEFQAGHVAYEPNGAIVEVAAKIAEGYVVHGGAQTDSETGEVYFDRDRVRIARKLFLEEPIKAYSEAVTKLQASADALRSEIIALHSEKATIEADHAAFMKDASRYSALVELKAFMAGAITHLVIEDWSGITIAQWGEAERRKEGHSYDLKLLTLFGSTKGDLRWQLNRYSGSNRDDEQVFPETSLDAARVTAERRIATWLTPDARSHFLETAVKSADALGFAVPDWAREKLEKNRHDNALARLAKLDEERVRLAAELAVPA